MILPLPLAQALAADRAKTIELADVSRETATRLERFVELLLSWQSRINLIAPSTVPTIWSRHIANSLQLIPLAPAPEPTRKQIWADLGSGAGFPGLVIACALADTDPLSCVHLVESNRKKATFLAEAIRETAAPAIVHAERIESIAPRLSGKVDIVTARALAPLKQLLTYLAPMVENGAQAILLKGQHLDDELAEASRYWKIRADIVPSKTSPTGKILIVRDLSRSRRP